MYCTFIGTAGYQDLGQCPEFAGNFLLNSASLLIQPPEQSAKLTYSVLRIIRIFNDKEVCTENIYLSAELQLNHAQRSTLRLRQHQPKTSRLCLHEHVRSAARCGCALQP